MKSEQIGDRIRLWRKHLKHTQETFAEVLGVHKGVLKKYEQGTNTPGGDALAKLAQTGVNVNWLLTGEGEMSAGQTLGESQEDLSDDLSEFQVKFKHVFEILLKIDEDKREAAVNEMLARVQEAARMNELERLVKKLQND